MNCKHQFFETCKIDPREYVQDRKESYDPLLLENLSLPCGLTIRFNEKGWGVSVTCALCNEKRNLYYSGDIEIMPPNSKPKSL